MQGVQILIITAVLSISSSVFACKIKNPNEKIDFKCLRVKVSELYEIPKQGVDKSRLQIAETKTNPKGLKVIQ